MVSLTILQECNPVYPIGKLRDKPNTPPSELPSARLIVLIPSQRLPLVRPAPLDLPPRCLALPLWLIKHPIAPLPLLPLKVYLRPLVFPDDLSRPGEHGFIGSRRGWTTLV